MLAMFAGMAAAIAEPPHVTQVIVRDSGRPQRRYPGNLQTTLTADCPQGRVRFTYFDAQASGQRRIQQLMVGGTEYTPAQLTIVEALFAGLRVNHGTIADCGELEQDRVRIHVSFMRPGAHTANMSTYVATIDVLADRVTIHPRDLANLQSNDGDVRR